MELDPDRDTRNSLQQTLLSDYDPDVRDTTPNVIKCVAQCGNSAPSYDTAGSCFVKDTDSYETYIHKLQKSFLYGLLLSTINFLLLAFAGITSTNTVPQPFDRLGASNLTISMDSILAGPAVYFCEYSKDDACWKYSTSSAIATVIVLLYVLFFGSWVFFILYHRRLTKRLVLGGMLCLFHFTIFAWVLVTVGVPIMLQHASDAYRKEYPLYRGPTNLYSLNGWWYACICTSVFPLAIHELFFAATAFVKEPGVPVQMQVSVQAMNEIHTATSSDIQERATDSAGSVDAAFTDHVPTPTFDRVIRDVTKHSPPPITFVFGLDPLRGSPLTPTMFPVFPNLD